MDFKECWLRILTEISLQISRSYLITYFKDSAILGFTEDGTFIIGVPRPMFLNWHLEHTHDKILQIAKKFNPEIKEVVFQVDGTLEGDKSRTIDIIIQFPDKKKGRKIPKKQEIKLIDGITSKILNPKYTLSNYVVGSNNQMAHAASSAVAASPGEKYNPLFIYGGVGLGKTHLLQSIGNEIIKNSPDKLVVYITSETFTNEVVGALQKRNMEKFRKRYRNVDVLIIDDVQFFAGKDKTQEEFFHTFNTLHEAGKQVIISSDRPPKEFNGIEERIVSRCEWGMIVDTKMPDFETRLAILYEKAKNYQALIPSEVFEFIAFNVHHSIRELEGILMQVIAILELKKETPSIEDVAAIIKRLNKDVKLQGFEKNTPVLAKDMESVVHFVADYYNVTASEVIGQKRSREFMLPRQISMYFCKHSLNQSLKKIGEFFEGRDHTSVIHAVKKFEGDMKKDPSLKKDVEVLKREMGI
ncbi:chromosomal replication initiator protein DnaA [Candidatus Peregrinibacteria bacterium]|nr:chromosomal replication initiator protein DnaA [Candidatus Peregrinibacteria bacterium]